MRASYLQPSSLQYSSFLRKEGAKQAALILMKNSHFNRTPLYLVLGILHCISLPVVLPCSTMPNLFIYPQGIWPTPWTKPTKPPYLLIYPSNLIDITKLRLTSCSFFGCGRLKITLCLGGPANPAITPFTPEITKHFFPEIQRKTIFDKLPDTNILILVSQMDAPIKVICSN